MEKKNTRTKIKLLLLIPSLILGFVVIPGILLWVGFTQISPLFRGDFTQHFGSIEVSYIQMAKFIESSWPRFAWQPRWYLGYPMTILYTPLVPFFEVFSHNLFGWTFGHAYRVLTAASFVGTLVSVYLLGKTWFKNSIAGFVAALSYGILPSIMAILYSEVAADIFAETFIDPRRFTILVRWGEGPHIVSLLFLPIAALFWILFLRHGNKWALVFGAIFSGLTALTNSIGAWGLLLLIFAAFIGELAENISNWRVVFNRSLVFGALSIGLIAFWFNPLFLSSFFAEGGGAISYWRDAFPWGWLMIGGVLGGYIVATRFLLNKFAGVSGSLLFAIITFWLVNTYYASGAEKIELVPQVLRLNTEVDLAVSLIIGGGISVLGYFLVKKNYWVYLGTMVAIAILASVLFYSRQTQIVTELPKFARSAEEVSASLTSIPEYEIAKKVESKISGDERAFLPGNYAFYLDLFTDVPQIRGALFQSAIHPWPEHIYYQVTNGKNGEISLSWLKIANVGWLVYSPVREAFRDFKYVGREKFDETLIISEELGSGDVLYQVPLENSSLAKAVPKEIRRVNKPVNAIDEEPINDYVSFLEASANELDYQQIGNSEYKIQGELDEGEEILVQSTYVPGWRAFDGNRKKLNLSADPLGFILISPETAGKQDITLRYTIPMRVWVGWIVTFVTIILVVVILLLLKKPVFQKQKVVKEVSEEM